MNYKQILKHGNEENKNFRMKDIINFDNDSDDEVLQRFKRPKQSVPVSKAPSQITKQVSQDYNT